MIERTQKTVRSAERPDSQAAGRFLMTGPDTGPHLMEVKRISTTEPRLNDRIRAQRCRLISDDGEQLGIFMVSDALRMADEQGLDLVEIAPNADPPVCKTMDYGKYKYEMEQKAKKARKNQTRVEVKEIKFRPKIDTHDYETKKKHVVRFLEAGAKVKVTIMFRGREMVHAERGLAILERLEADIADLAFVESKPKLEGRNMFMLVAPHKKEPVKAKPAEKKQAEADESDDAAEPPQAAEAASGDAAAKE
jgi:translation initiation factor IF-3